MTRRKFLKAGVPAAVLALGPPLMKANSHSPRNMEGRAADSASGCSSKSLIAIAEKYGGEFGGVKPVERRASDGRI